MRGTSVVRWVGVETVAGVEGLTGVLRVSEAVAGPAEVCRTGFFGRGHGPAELLRINVLARVAGLLEVFRIGVCLGLWAGGGL